MPLRVYTDSFMRTWSGWRRRGKGKLIPMVDGTLPAKGDQAGKDAMVAALIDAGFPAGRAAREAAAAEVETS